MFRASLAALLASSSLGVSPAMASEAETAAADMADAADPIVVIGQREQYGVRSTSTGTKTDTDIKDIPQAISVISESQIEDQQLRSIADVMLFVPGASTGTGESNRDQITLRGNNTTADFFVDGVRDDVQYFRDFYNVERIEILKGPNAMIFGRGGGGGIVNRVTKQTAMHASREVIASGDSYGGVRVTGDIDQPLGQGVGLRINGMHENGDSFRHHVDLERYGINPTIGLLAGPDTRIDLSFEHLHDRRTTDRGVPSDARDGAATLANPIEPLKGFDDIFFGDPDQSFAKADVNVGTLTVEHRFAEGLTLRNRTLYGDYDKFYQNIYPNSAALPATLTQPERVRLAAYNNRNDRQNLISQTDLVWENRLGGIDQTLLFGMEFGRQKSRNQRLSGTISGTSIIDGNAVPLTDPTVDVDVIFASLPSDANNRAKASFVAAYVQDQIRISPMFEIVAGLRFDSFKLEVDDLRPQVNREFERKDELWSPRLGLIFKPLENLSIYASYSRSYLPQSGDQFGSLDVTTEALKPEKFDNYEIGAKWEPVEGLLATVAIYRLDRTNTRATDPVSHLTVLTGEQRSKGIELGLERSIMDNWQVSAGYAWQKAEVTEATTACASGDCEVALVPRHSFSLWTRYDVSQQFGIGVGAVARSKSFTSIGNTVELPGYARFDAALYYELMEGIDLQLNVENLFGADYFVAAHSDNNIAPGAPTTARASIRFGF
jgi:catecholate siderophore receptor